MKAKPTNNPRRLTTASTGGSVIGWQTAPRPGIIRFGALSLLALLITALPSLRAQQVTALVAQPVRVTAPVNSSGSTSVACALTINTNGLSAVDANGNWVINPITLSAAGVPATPSGLSFTFTDSDTNAITQIIPTISTNDASITTNIVLWVNTTNVSEGVYTYSLNTGGAATDTLLLNVQVAHVWTGADFTNSGAAGFSDAANWNGGNVAGPASDVVVNDDGGVGHNVTTTNILVSANTEIASFRQAITSGGTRRDNVQINDGATLMVTGTNGFSAGLRDQSDTSQSWELAFTGGQGTLVVSNQDADFDTFAIENQTPYLYMNDLGTFIADLRQMHFDDYRVYPNYDSMADNGYNNAALPRRMPVPQVYWARTNIIHLNFPGDPADWTNSGFHQYSMIIGNDTGRGGSTQRHHFWFGISNLLEMNSVCFAGSGVAMDQSSGSAGFNSAFSSDNPIAIFRGPNGMNDRMAMFTVADNSGEGSSGSSTKAIVDLTGGTVDALVDTLILGRDRTNANGGYARGELDIGAGTFDVNQAFIGYQNEGNNSGSSEDYCQGVLSVGNNGVFIAHDSIDLGWTTADATNNSTATANASSGYGQITVNAGGTVIANVIRVGGVTGLSGGAGSAQNGGPNAITLNGGTLIVSNTIAGPGKMLNSLSMSDGTLTLFVNATNSNPYVYATNLLTSGSANTINIASLTNVTSYPEHIPLIQYVSASPILVVTLPSGYYGFILNNTVNHTIDVVVDTNAPASVVWSGGDGNWNHSSLNWDSGTKAFADGDFVTFDDTATGPTTINVTESVVPGQSATMPGTTITNSSKDYTFNNGGGLIAGTASMLKEGSGMLTVNVDSQNPLTIEGGTVEGSGTIGATTLGTNSTLNFSGTIGGLTSSGTASSSGPITGPVAINAGSFVNSGTVNTTPGGMAIGNDCTVTNMSGSYFEVYGGNWAVGSGSVLANLGEIDNYVGRLNLNSGATFFGNGYIFDYTGTESTPSAPNSADSGRLAVNSGSICGIGDAPSNSIGSMTVYARIDVNQGGAMIFDIDTDHNTYDQVNADILGNIRGTFVMNRIGAAPFSAGQSFQLFNFSTYGHNLPQTAHLDYSFQPPVPGPGLQWVTGGNFISNGIVSVVAAPTSPPKVSTKVSGGNLTLSWPPDHIGWQLQVQTNDLSTGISTNWFTVTGSENATNAVITVDPTAPSVFYRLVDP
jgi:hypothetical protein